MIRTLFLVLLASCVSGLALAAPTVRLRNTYYYVCLESVYSGQAKDDVILDLHGALIARVSHAFRKAVDIEGTGRLDDGRIINYAGRVGGQVRYFISDAEFGYGVGKCRLVPFHTIAVDPTVVPLGSLVYIKETDGMILPNGERHNGLWRADDIGGAILHDRVDLFVGDGNRGDVLDRAGIRNLQALTVTLVEQPAPGNCAAQATLETP